jgi:hypothetical protein
VRERPRNRQRVVHVHPRQLVGELAEVGVVARAPALRQRAHALDRREDALARLGADGVAQQFPEQPHVVAQRLVRIGHDRIVVVTLSLQMWGASAGPWTAQGGVR